MLQTFNSNVIFKFVEEITGGRFNNSTSSGLIVTSDDKEQSGFTRWGQVTAVGPDCYEIEVGDYILIEAGKWTTGFYHDSARYWKTEEKHVLLTSDEPSYTY